MHFLLYLCSLKNSIFCKAMKKIIGIFILLATLSSCKDRNNIYSDLLKEERALITQYITTHNIAVDESMEMPSSWQKDGKDVYWKIPDYDDFYFHLVSAGDTTLDEVTQGKNVLLRFKRYTLDAYADTLFNWTTLDNPEPVKFQYMIDSEYSCTGWQLAIKYMKHKGAQSKIICPHRLGFEEEQSSVTPYGYDLKITNIK